MSFVQGTPKSLHSFWFPFKPNPTKSSPQKTNPFVPETWQLNIGLDLKLSHYAHDSGFSWNCRFPNCGCALDGRLSAVSFRNQTLLYARANVKPQGGGRFVQVARQDELGWGAFSAIHILDYDMFEGDIYMFYVNVNPANSSTLLALFPILDRGKNRSSIAMSLSEDGVWWSSVVDLIATVPSYGGRTFDHPVDGLEAAPFPFLLAQVSWIRNMAMFKATTAQVFTYIYIY